MVTSEEHATLYSKLRAALLSRHFALGTYFRANLLSLDNTLATRLENGDFLKLDKADQERERWNITDHMRENPLLFGGQLLTCLAVEHALGHPDAIKIIGSALQSLNSLYKFKGRHFDGYILRWDPVTSDKWVTASQNGKDVPQYCQEFLIGQNDRYLYCCPATDPRHVPLRSSDQLRNLMSETELQRYLDNHNNYVDWYRLWEPSMDELVGLLTGYFMVYHLVSEPGFQRLIRQHINNLGDYLAEHGYILVRPCGGLTARGATGILPALEFPFVRAMLSITGNTYSARVDFIGAMEKANYWKSLEGPTRWWTLAGIASVAVPVIYPFVQGILLTLGLSTLVTSGTVFTPIQLARAWAIYQHRDCFDVSNDGAAQEVAGAYLLMEIAAQRRFELWLEATRSFGVPGAAATGFPPWLALTALDDANTAVRDAYLAWLPERLKHPELDQGAGAQTCFASAVAVLLGAGPAEEARLAGLLETRYNELHEDPAHPGNAQDNLTVVKNDSSIVEMHQHFPDLDYMAALALAWLHFKRRAEAGNPVTTQNFPALPNNILFWPPPAVPQAVVQRAQSNEIILPVEAIQQNPNPQLTDSGALLFNDPRPPAKSTEPAPILPQRPTQLIFDKRITVQESDTDVGTGITLHSGDEYEFEADGSISAGVLLTGTNGPNGWDWITNDARYPLHSALDPVNAHPFCLLGKLNSYFFIGDRRPRERYLYHQDCPLFLRINDDSPGNGSGEFSVHIRVWGAPRLKVVDFSAVSYAFIFVPSIWFRVLSENYRTAAVTIAVSKDGSPYSIIRTEDPYGNSVPAAFVGDWRGRMVQTNTRDRLYVWWLGKTVDGPDYYNQNGTFTFRINATDPGAGTSETQFTSIKIEWHGSEISCITKNRRKDPTQRIQFVGGLHPDGRSWKLSLAEAIAEIKRGQQFYVEQPAGDRVQVVVAVSRWGHQNLKTEADGDLPNNLLSLSECPQ